MFGGGVVIVMLPFLAAVLVHPDVEASRSEPRAPLHRWNLVAECESGQDWQANTGNGYEGGLQFAPSTWVAEGGREYAEHAYDASEAQQIEVAERLLRDAGVGAWPRCGHWLEEAAA